MRFPDHDINCALNCAGFSNIRDCTCIVGHPPAVVPERRVALDQTGNIKQLRTQLNRVYDDAELLINKLEAEWKASKPASTSASAKDATTPNEG